MFVKAEEFYLSHNYSILSGLQPLILVKLADSNDDDNECDHSLYGKG